MTRARLVLDVDEKPKYADRLAIAKRLRAFNEVRLGPRARNTEFAVYVRDGDGAIVGAIVAMTYWDWMYVDNLWMDESLRGRGFGTRLMRAAERIAVKRGCRAA